MKAVDIVTVEELITIYKNGEEANSIQVAKIKDSEGTILQFNIIVGKGLYNIGDKAIYIQPDFCIPNTEFFKEYYAPNGDEKKSKLGKKGRIRAVKFNFQFKGETDAIYSNGIILPLNVFKDSKIDLNGDLQEQFQVIKYVAEDSYEGQSKGLIKGDLPNFLYATDEPRIESLKEEVDLAFNEKEIVCGTIKRDGSSATIYYINLYGNREIGICSRKMEKKLDQQYTSGYKDGDIVLHPYLNKEINQKGWYNDFTQKFYTDEEVKNFEPITIEVRDAWVDTIKKYGYLDKLVDYCRKQNVQLALRGELIGSGNKGSGNKLNLDAKGDCRIVWFSVDDLSSGHARRTNYGHDHNLIKICEELELEYTKNIFEGIYSYDELIKKCNDIFKEIKTNSGQIVEGIVIRSKYSNKISTKYINPEYDANS